MIDELSSMFWRLKSVKNIDQALKQILSPSVVGDAMKRVGSGAALVETLASQESLDPQGLMSKVAERIGLKSQDFLELPSSELVQRANITHAEISRIGVVPQDDNQQRIAWLITDLSQIQELPGDVVVDACRLVLPSVIGPALRQASLLTAMMDTSGLISHEQIQAILTQLAVDAASKGANEVFLGYPDPDYYEFVVDEDCYSGSLHGMILQELTRWLTNKGTVRLKLPFANISSLSLTLNRNFANRMVFLGWEDMQQADLGELEDSVLGVNGAKDNSEKESKLVVSPKFVPPKDESRKVFLVEDDKKFSRIFSNVLSRENFSVKSFESVEDVLQEMDRELPDLLITDIHLPGLSGKELTKTLRDRELSIPVLVLTSDDAVILEAELLEIGADAFLRKDEEPAVILAWCNRLCRAERIVRSKRKQGNEKIWTVH